MRTSEHLTIGEVYSRATLREMFGITDNTIKTGIFRPREHDSIWLFITEKKRRDRTQYQDRLEGDILEWDGQTSGRKDHLIMGHMESGLELLIFYRREIYEYPDAGFRYEGPFEYVSHRGNNPAHFTLRRVVSISEAREHDLQREVEETATTFLERDAAKAKGQGFVSSLERRKVVERHAMAVAKAHLEELGFKIEDTSLTKPYDLLARKRGDHLFVEVKGTTTPGEEIVLTFNEVEHARQNKIRCMLFILADVQVRDGSDGPVASGGTKFLLWPWDVDAGRLLPISYNYRPHRNPTPLSRV